MTSRFLNGSRYGRVARKAAGFQDSGGREPEVLIKVVFDGCGRERKPRTLSMVVPEARIMKFLESARPKGRAWQRVRRKGHVIGVVHTCDRNCALMFRCDCMIDISCVCMIDISCSAMCFSLMHCDCM